MNAGDLYEISLRVNPEHIIPWSMTCKTAWEIVWKDELFDEVYCKRWNLLTGLILNQPANHLWRLMRHPDNPKKAGMNRTKAFNWYGFFYNGNYGKYKLGFLHDGYACTDLIDNVHFLYKYGLIDKKVRIPYNSNCPFDTRIEDEYAKMSEFDIFISFFGKPDIPFVKKK